MSERRDTTSVLIVGGGPSGLVSALLLARWNVRSIVIERNDFTDGHPKAHELNARSIEILRDAGISEAELAVEASPQEDASRILFCRTINEELGRIDLLSEPERRRKYEKHLRQDLPYLNLSQTEFEKILVKHAEASPLIDVRFGHCWESHAASGDSVVSTVRGDTEYTVESQFLLGCDGASSRVRRAVGIGMDGPAAIQTFVNAYFQMNLRERVSTPGKLFWIIHPEYAGTFIAHHMEKRWVYGVPVHEPWERPEDFTSEVMRERIEGALGFRVPELEITSLSTWRMTAQVARSYRQGRVFLVGDAAHRFPPTGGLGMNTGIADAHNLCWKVGLVLSGRAGDPLLDTYEMERRPVAARNCAESVANFERIWDVVRALGLEPEHMKRFARFLNSVPMRILSRGVRDGVVRLLTRPPFWMIGRGLRPGRVQARVREAIAAQIGHFDRLGLDIGYIYERGALLRADGESFKASDGANYVATTAPGARLPHCWAGTGDERHSTHDCLSYSEFRLLAQGDCSRRLPIDLPEGVHAYDTSGFPSELFPSGEILLVRPDGHIAWRGPEDMRSGREVAGVMSALLNLTPSKPSLQCEVGEPA